MTGGSSPQPANVEVISHAADLFARYDVLVCDIWGVVHDGARAYAGAGDAFARFRRAGGTVLLLSNAPMPSSWVEHVLAEKGVRQDSWDAIVSSGDVTLTRIADRGLSRVHHIGPPRDLPLFTNMSAARVELAKAQAVVCTGLIDDRRESAEDYRPLLAQALDAQLELICANPDLIVDVGGELLPCAGVVAELYERMGGQVYWAGKPHLPAYRMAMDAIARLRGTSPPLNRILAIGDAVRTDLAGAATFGIDSLFIGQGIHRDEVVANGAIDAAALSRLLDNQPRTPVAAMLGVAW